MTKFIIFYLFFIPFLITACHQNSKQKRPADATQIMKNAVEEVLGKKFKTSPNGSRDLVLCLAKNEIKSELMYTTKVVVWDSAARKIIFQKNYPGGKVRWRNHDHIEVSQMPGIVRPNEGEHAFLINVRTGQKQALNTDLK